MSEVVPLPWTATTTALTDSTDVVNTSLNKVAGIRVWNTTTSRPVWAVGNADDDVWVDHAGTTVHTPVP